MPDRETNRLIGRVDDEVTKQALVQRMHNKLWPHRNQEKRMHVHVWLDVAVAEGHPAQVLAALRERLAGLSDEVAEDGVAYTVDRVAKIEIL